VYHRKFGACFDRSGMKRNARSGVWIQRPSCHASPALSSTARTRDVSRPGNGASRFFTVALP
jgi:hypothetical protein